MQYRFFEFAQMPRPRRTISELYVRRIFWEQRVLKYRRAVAVSKETIFMLEIESFERLM
jgi:hypothetical protein